MIRYGYCIRQEEKKVWLGFLVMNLGTYPESSAEKVVEQAFFTVGKIYYQYMKLK